MNNCTHFTSSCSDIEIISNGQVLQHNSFILVGSAFPREVSCFLQGIQLREANVTWFFPNGLQVPFATVGSNIHQVDTSSSRDNRVESTLVWRPQVVDEESFNGDGFYLCHVSTPSGVEDTKSIGVFRQEPSK